MSLSISENGLALIKKFEGCRLTAYQDSIGVWTIGYGHTSGVSKGQAITQNQADAFLRADCSNAERYVNSYNSKYNWNQNQFDALVSFTFNCGSGNLKMLLGSGQRSIAQISEKIPAYNKAGGKVLNGLVNRRKAEKELFDKAVSDALTPTVNTSAASDCPTAGKVTNCTKLNMRKTPKVAAGNIITVLNVNDIVDILKNENGWYQVRTKNNIVGYVSGKYIMVL